MEKQNFDKAYVPQSWEGVVYDRWEKSGLFNPDQTKSKKRYANILPPPNANGELHLGHASGYTVMDIFGRFERMRGKRTLLLPGKDHAGIQTQVVFEKKLQAEQGMSRHDLGRERFFNATYDFCIDRSQYMRSQEKRIGLSADWSREKFTLDPEVSERTLATFAAMYRDGLIYRGKRLINWCPRCATALSDIEVIHKKTDGKLFFLRYPIKDSPDFITVATTRPETMLGDAAVAVHPDDTRHQSLVGQTVILPLLERPIPVIADARIDAGFGTGAVKVTPAHDPLDWEIGEEHQLPTYSVIDERAHITQDGGKYAGLTATAARTAILADLAVLGLVEKEEAHSLNLAQCERCKTTVEPLISKQWFVSVDAPHRSLKQQSISALRANAIIFHPASMRDEMIRWLEHLRDWCISRQLWWGHRIPVWYCLSCRTDVVSPKIKAKWFLVRHGETELNRKQVRQGHLDSPLTEEGKMQVQQAAEKLRGQDIGLIISSDLGRCRETASLIADTLKIPVEYDSGLRERSYGDTEGLSYEEAKERYGHPYAAYEESPGNIETPKALEERIAATFKKHKEVHGHKNVVIVSHGGALRMLMKQIRNLSFEEIRQHPGIKNAEVLSLDIVETPCQKCGGDLFEQDPDTLDTWFSSGQWPYTTLGYPDGTDANNFYPTDMMVMGRDLLFFWATRMVMFGLYRTGVVPFRHLYFTGLVRDKEGQKMSKSKGNGIDVLEMIDRYGADAVRLSLIFGTTPGLDFRLYDEKIASFRNFANKLWNMGRFVAGVVDPALLATPPATPEPSSLADHWVLIRLSETVASVTAHLEKYQLSLAAEKLREFTWNDVADWYLETSKVEKNDAVLATVFTTLLRLWHPFMPFVTEALHASLSPKGVALLMNQTWPLPEHSMLASENSAANARSFESLRELIVAIRAVRTLYRIDPKRLLSLTLVAPESTSSAELFKRLGRLDRIIFTSEIAQPKETARVAGGSELIGFIHLSGVIDIATEEARLNKELEQLEHYRASVSTRLDNPQFTLQAPADIVARERSALEETTNKILALKQALHNLK